MQTSLAPSASQTKPGVQQGKVGWYNVLDTVRRKGASDKRQGTIK